MTGVPLALRFTQKFYAYDFNSTFSFWGKMLLPESTSGEGAHDTSVNKFSVRSTDFSNLHMLSPQHRLKMATTIFHLMEPLQC